MPPFLSVRSAGLHPLVEPSAMGAPTCAYFDVTRSIAATAHLVEKLLAISAVASSNLLIDVFRDDEVAAADGLDHFARDNPRAARNLCDGFLLVIRHHDCHFTAVWAASGPRRQNTVLSFASKPSATPRRKVG
jgi:hypothetical protein